VYSTLPTCCSEAEEDLEHFDEEFLASDYPRPIACGVMVSFRCCIFDRVRFSLMYDNIRIINNIFVSLVILYPFSGHIYYEYLVRVLKPGMTYILLNLVILHQSPCLCY
jgi:hypothetical protein